MTAPIQKRATCPQCLRAQSTCICHWATKLSNAVEVLILQHPLEVNQAKGSGRLLHLCLAQSHTQTGELFAAESLHDMLFANGKTPILLYPQTHTTGTHQAALFDSSLAAEKIRLVVLDATWRKSRKMLHLNPQLQQLPRLALDKLGTLPPSRYQIRKAHAAHQLSSMEATCYALMQLENDVEKFAPLLASFDGFINQMQQQIAQLK